MQRRRCLDRRVEGPSRRQRKENRKRSGEAARQAAADDPDEIVSIFEPHSASTPNLVAYVRSLWQRRKFISELAKSDIKGTRSSTALGTLWGLLDPFFQSTIYFFLYVVIRGNSSGGSAARPADFLPVLIGGVFLFNLSGQALNEGGRSVPSIRASLMLNSSFPRALLPIASVYKGMLELRPHGPRLHPDLRTGRRSATAGPAHPAAALRDPGRPEHRYRPVHVDGRRVLPRMRQTCCATSNRILFFTTPIIFPAVLLDKFQPWVALQPFYALFSSYQAALLGGTADPQQVLQAPGGPSPLRPRRVGVPPVRTGDGIETLSMQLIVLGMHRSGTSAATRLLNLAGAYFGTDDDATESNRENPKGFWERRDVRDVCDGLLLDSGFDWWRTADFDLSGIPVDVAERHRSTFAGIVGDLDHHAPWVVKEPRLCLLLPVLLETLEAPICVHVHREPVEVAASVARRNGFPLAAGLALWEQYTLAALRSSHGCPRVHLNYADIMADPRQQLADLIAWLGEQGVGGLTVPADTEIAEFIDPELHRNRREAADRRGLLNEAQRALADAADAGLLEEFSRSLPSLSAGAVDALRALEATQDLRARLEVSGRS